MRLKTLILFLLVVISTSSFAGLRCDLASKLGDPKIVSNLDFWEEFNKLQASGKLHDRDLESLFKKYGVDSNGSAPSVPSVAQSRPFSYSTTSKADKDLKKLPNNLRKNYEEFMSIMSDRDGFKALYDNPGRWHYEKLKAQDNLHTVRLNGGYRVLFKKVDDGNGIEVLEVNRDSIHAI